VYSLQNLHTFGLNSRAHALEYLTSKADLESFYANNHINPVVILGEGSNTVFLRDYQGLVLVNRLKGVEVTEDLEYYYCSVASGENWHQFVELTLKKKIYGLENLALIPGTVGASPIQNIGAYGVEVERFIESVDYFDIAERAYKNIKSADCNFAYRESIFKKELAGRVFITAVNFKFAKNADVEASYSPLNQLISPTPHDIFDLVVKTRQEKLPDPRVYGNSGSFFKNPVIHKTQFDELQKQYPHMPSFNAGPAEVKVPAAWLIDTLGFKGKECDGIQCHVKQPLVLLNKGSGSGEGLLMLARQIKSSVSQQFNISLENEVRLMGEASLEVL
jgi:UDP-N-acetylmuramate dehydrogenase